MRYLLIILLFATSCQKDMVCYCEEIQDGYTVKEYPVFDYAYENSQGVDKCTDYAKEQRPSMVAGKQDFVFDCHGRFK